MKITILSFILIISYSGLSQNFQVDFFSDLVNAPGQIQLFPTLGGNKDNETLCFLRNNKQSNRDEIFISKKISDKQWSKPISVATYKNISNVIISPAIDKIYFSYYHKSSKKHQTYQLNITENGEMISYDYLFPGIIHSITRDGKLKVVNESNILLKSYQLDDQGDWKEEFTYEYEVEKKNVTQRKNIFYPKENVNGSLFFNSERIYNSQNETKAILNQKVIPNWFDQNTGLGLFQLNGKIGIISQVDVENEESERQPQLSIPTIEKGIIQPIGHYYALLIGVGEYDNQNLNLTRPVDDLKSLKRVLIENYTFNEQNVTELINPTREEIIIELFRLRNKISTNDNLLVFYAGHGYWDEQIKQGYWWPRDATKNSPSQWLSNSDIREQVRGINSAHTLLISDACFSGGIFQTRGNTESLKSANLEIQLLYKTPSRRAMTSGSLSAVPDQSIFFDYLIKKLRNNTEDFLAAQNLFYNIKNAVINNSLNIPQEGVILNTGDEGGDFIFIKNNSNK